MPVANPGPAIDCLDKYPDCIWSNNPESAKLVSSFDGVFTERSTVKLSEITDGLSNTMLIGEKHLSPSDYETGTDSGDDDSMYTGNDMDVTRWVGTDPDHLPMPPMWDDDLEVIRNQLCLLFGSAHSGALQVAFCDGRVVPISYSIDPKAFLAIGTRAGGEANSSAEPE
jgi:prepilin-type processing-associated H-X9-DG protein